MSCNREDLVNKFDDFTYAHPLLSLPIVVVLAVSLPIYVFAAKRILKWQRS